jgi:hypothetical protein
MEVRVLYEGVPGQVAVKARAGAYQSGRRSKDVTTWRWMGSVRLVVSSLPSGEAITDEAWGLGPGEVRWDTVRSRELELLFGR